MCTIYRSFASSFKSVLCSLFRLCENNPAPTSSTRESAACNTTRERCKNEVPAPVVRAPLRKASTGCVCAAIQAGATPKRRPVSSDKPKANPITITEGLAWIGTFCVSENASFSSIVAPNRQQPVRRYRPSKPPVRSRSVTVAQSLHAWHLTLCARTILRVCPFRAPAASSQYSRRRSTRQDRQPTSANADEKNIVPASAESPGRQASAPNALLLIGFCLAPMNK